MKETIVKEIKMNEEKIGGYYLKVKRISPVTIPLFEVIQIEEKNKDDKLEKFYKEINCRSIDYISFPNNMDIIVDDEGLFKQGNPVFKIRETDQTNEVFVPGEFLIGTNIKTEEGKVFAGYPTEKELYLALAENKITIDLFGLVKW